MSFELDPEDPIELTLEDEPEELQLTLDDENEGNLELTFEEPEELQLQLEDTVPDEPVTQPSITENNAELELTLEDEPDELTLELADEEPELVVDLKDTVPNDEPRRVYQSDYQEELEFDDPDELTLDEEDEQLELTFDDEPKEDELEINFDLDIEDDDELELTFSETDGEEQQIPDELELQLTFDDEGEFDNAVELELKFEDDEQPLDELDFSDEIPEIVLSMNGTNEEVRTVEDEAEPDQTQLFNEEDMLMMNFDDVDPELRSFFEKKPEPEPEEEQVEEGDKKEEEPEEEPTLLKTGVKKTGIPEKDRILARCDTTLRKKLTGSTESFVVNLKCTPLKNTPKGQKYLYFTLSAFTDGDWSVIGQTEKIKNDTSLEYLTFKTPSKWEFIFGMVQRMKLNFFACLDEDAMNKSTKEVNLEESMLDMQAEIYGSKKNLKKDEEKTLEPKWDSSIDMHAEMYNSTTDMIDLGMYDDEEGDMVDDSDELNFEDLIFPTELGSVEFTIGEILMNLAGSFVPETKNELLKGATRSKKFEIKFANKPKFYGKSTVDIMLLLPNPEDHMVPRIINEDLTHMKIAKIDHFTEVEYQTLSVSLKLRVDNLKSMGKDIKVDPHFMLFRDSQDFQQRLYHSEVQKNIGGSATYRLFTFGVGSEKSMSNALKIEFWYQKKFFGQIEFTILELRSGIIEYTLRDPMYPLEERGKVTFMKYEERIWLNEIITKKILTEPVRLITQFYYVNPFTCMNYIGYHKLHVSLAIDFTSSNGLVPGKNKHSFHFLGGGSKNLNPYETSITATLKAILQFNQQMNIKTYGFGHMKTTKIKGDYFEVTKGPNRLGIETRKSETSPINKVLKHYRKTAKEITMGITNEFKDIIQAESEEAMKAHSYCILIILLDGDKVSSPENYIQLLKATYRSGISVVFIGIGADKFKNLKMYQSECTNVTFTRYVNDETIIGAKALRNIPAQMKDYYASRREVPELQSDVHYVQ